MRDRWWRPPPAALLPRGSVTPPPAGEWCGCFTSRPRWELPGGRGNPRQKVVGIERGMAVPIPRPRGERYVDARRRQGCRGRSVVSVTTRNCRAVHTVAAQRATGPLGMDQRGWPSQILEGPLHCGPAPSRRGAGPRGPATTTRPTAKWRVNAYTSSIARFDWSQAERPQSQRDAPPPSRRCRTNEVILQSGAGFRARVQDATGPPRRASPLPPPIGRWPVSREEARARPVKPLQQQQTQPCRQRRLVCTSVI